MKDRETDGRERKDLHRPSHAHREPADRSALALVRGEGNDDQPGDERIALDVLERSQHVEEHHRTRQRGTSRWKYHSHRHPQHPGVQRVPCEQRHGKRKERERKKEEGDRRRILVEVEVYRRIGGVEILPLEEVERRGAKDQKIVVLVPDSLL